MSGFGLQEFFDKFRLREYFGVLTTEYFERVIEDYDGNEYDVILINGQEWIMQNLRVEHYADGTDIPNITDPTLWDADTDGSFRSYNDDPLNVSDYGHLYNWHAGQNAHVLPYFTYGGIQESGWRLPTRTEYEALVTYLGGTADAHDHLRETGLTYWNSSDDEDNSTEFSARGAGMYEAVDDGMGGLMDYWFGLNQITYFWTDTEEDATTAYNLTLGFDSADVGMPDKKSLGRSIRCVRDLP